MPRTQEANRRIRERRREQILAGAVEVFARKGFAATTISDIAAATAMSQGLIYRYFSSKEDLFAVLVKHATAGTAALALQALSLQTSPWERLRWFTAHMMPHQYQHPAYALVVAHALTNEAVPPAVQDTAQHHVAVLRMILAEIIVAGQARGQVVQGDPEQLTLVYLAALHGLAAMAAFVEEPKRGFPDASSVLRLLSPER